MSCRSVITMCGSWGSSAHRYPFHKNQIIASFIKAFKSVQKIGPVLLFTNGYSSPAPVHFVDPDGKGIQCNLTVSGQRF